MLTDNSQQVRRSGILLHPTSLPGRYGHGDLGPAAYRFVDWLAAAGQHLWQVLPLSPPGSENSPYMSTSSFAGNVALISPELLKGQGLLSQHNLEAADERHTFQSQRINFSTALPQREELLKQAAQRFFAKTDRRDALQLEFSNWFNQNASWAEDHALFTALAESGLGNQWHAWPEDLRHRHAAALAQAAIHLEADIKYQLFAQWQFDKQWLDLRHYAQKHKVLIVGDIPVYCAYDSVDVWCHPNLFQLDSQLSPVSRAGVPPDYFSETGQLWGNPLYDWEAHSSQQFEWWIARIKRVLTHANLVRLDHFRGLVAYWSVHAGAETAIQGKWRRGPGKRLFEQLYRSLGKLNLIAEDLGNITPYVTHIREAFNLPGICVLQFAFSGSADNPYLPHNLQRNCVLYTGTHDNNTTLGWFAEATAAERQCAQVYLKTNGQEIHWDLIHAASASVANSTIYPMQDVLGLDSDARMNQPGLAHGQWGWRFSWNQLQTWHTQRLLEISVAHGRHLQQV